MAYRLRDGLSFCIVGGRTIFLDIHADRYFCCPSALETDLQMMTEGKVPASSRGIDWLVEHRVLVENDATPGGLTTVSIVAPQTSISPGSDPPPSPLAVAVALAAQLRASAWLRAVPLRQVVDRLAKLKAKLEASSARDDLVRRGALAFQYAGGLLSRRDRCLPHSIALARYYWRKGHPADLVIGVRRAPFAAHCWVQDRRHVLNDESDHVRSYTPIWML